MALSRSERAVVYLLSCCVADGPQTVAGLFYSLEGAQRAVVERSGRADPTWSGDASLWWTLTGDQSNDEARMWIISERTVQP